MHQYFYFLTSAKIIRIMVEHLILMEVYQLF